MRQETPTADYILNEACGQLTDTQAERDDWRAVAFAVAERCAAAEHRAAEVKQEAASLRSRIAELEEWKQFHCSEYAGSEMDRIAAEEHCRDLERRAAEAAEDTKRLDFIESEWRESLTTFDSRVVCWPDGMPLRTAIDAARTALDREPEER